MILVLSASLAQASPFTSHDDMVHDLAHFGAGTLAGIGFDLMTHVYPGPPLKPKTKFYGAIASAFVVNVAYEFREKKEPGIMAERIFFGTLGAVFCSYHINF